MTIRTVYLVRHGQRLDAVDKEWHKKDGGLKYDSPLSEEGIEQAQRIANRLRTERIEHIFVSPFVRALQTADAIAQARHQMFMVDWGVSEWHGRAMMPEKPQLPAIEERAERFPWLDVDHESQVFPQYPETVQQVFDRYERAMQNLMSRYEGNLLIVGHGRVVTGISHVLTQKPESHFKYPEAGLTKLVLDEAGTWEIRLNGDDTHLTAEPTVQFV